MRQGSRTILVTDTHAMAQEHAARELASDRVAPCSCSTREEFSRMAAPLTAPLFRLCLALCNSREEAEDLLQNALVKAFVHREAYRGDAPFLSWLYGIVRNERAETVRTAARRRGLIRNAVERFGLLFEDLVASGHASPESTAIQTQDADEILARVRDLPEAYREVVWMCDVEELSYELVAQALSIPLGTVKSRHARGRARLRTLITAAQMASDSGVLATSTEAP